MPSSSIGDGARLSGARRVGEGHGDFASSESADDFAGVTISLNLGASSQFTSAGATGWAATYGTVTSAGYYTAPTVLSATGTDTVTATGPNGSATATVTLIPPSPVITSVGANGQLPLGIFNTTITGTGFTATSIAELNGTALGTTFSNGALTVVGFASVSGAGSITVNNGSIVSPPFPVQIGIPNAQVFTAAAARRFLEQGAFGPTPSDAMNVQTLGFPAWLNQQFNMAQISNYNTITGSQGGMPPHFLTNAVSNPDQLRQRVAFALSQIFVTSIQKLIWNGNMVLFQNMLLNDAFANYRQIMSDVTLSPAMGQYLDMANNAMANPTQGTLANENYARELMQLFTIGTQMLNQDGSVRRDSNNLPIPTYLQPTISEFARVYTGWTYAPAAGQPVEWIAYISSNGPMVPYAAEHDSGSKQLLNGYVSPAAATPLQDLNNALDNIFNHPNVGPFVGKQLIQLLVKSNPSPRVYFACGGGVQRQQPGRARRHGGNHHRSAARSRGAGQRQRRQRPGDRRSSPGAGPVHCGDGARVRRADERSELLFIGPGEPGAGFVRRTERVQLLLAQLRGSGDHAAGRGV